MRVVGRRLRARNEAMRLTRHCELAMLICGVLSGVAGADEVRYYEQNGVTYRETRHKVSQPVPQTQLVDHPQTVYREKLDTQLVDTVRTYQVPVTEYRWETYMQGRWNPFVHPTMGWRQVPVTRWETRSDVVKVPYNRRQLVPETTTVRLPVTTMQTVEQEVITRVAVGSRQPADPFASSAPSVPFASTPPPARNPVPTPAAVASRPLTVGAIPSVGFHASSSPTRAVNVPAGQPIGGISKLEQDPPRMGANYQWRPSNSVQR
jgi:hypothetical protein